MSAKTLFRSIVLSFSLATLAACTAMRGPDDTAQDTAAAATTPTDVALASSNPAVIALLKISRSEAGDGQYPAATASIERALRIEPRNPVLWQELAILKLQQGDYQQAENFAARSNSWAGSNRPLLAKNWRIISEARALRGDHAGAEAALTRAKAFE